MFTASALETNSATVKTPQPRPTARPWRWLAVGVVTIAAGTGVLQGCASQEEVTGSRITIGVVAYGEGAQSLDRLETFQNYLAERTQSFVEIEPVFNEVKALEQIRAQRWSLVFSPPGLAAKAIATAQYIPLFPLQGTTNTVRSTIVVRDDSPIQALADLQRRSISLGQPGSATGYYLPLYDLFGLTLSDIQVAATPRDTLAAIAAGTVAAGAVARSEYDDYRQEFGDTQFRVIHTSRNLPAGVVLLGPNVDRNLQEFISQAMNDAPPSLASEAGYIPNASPPNYDFFIELIEKIAPYESRIHDVPARLFPGPELLEAGSAVGSDSELEGEPSLESGAELESEVGGSETEP